MARHVITESKLRARRRKQRALLIYISIVLAIAAITGVVFLLRADFMRIHTITVSGNTTVPTADITQRVSETISGNTLFVLPKDDILLYSKRSIVETIYQAFPAVRSVSVEATSFSSIAVKIQEQQPAAEWCGATAPVFSSSASSVASSTSINAVNCFLMNSDGLVYAPAPQFSQDPYLPFYGVLTGGGAPLPQQFLSPAAVHSLLALIPAISQEVNGAHVRAVAIRTDEVDAEATVYFSNGFSVLFLLKDDAGVVLDHFTSALSSSAFQGHTPADFEYLDLRFGDTLYYKLRAH